jgi:hypothetical protein
MLRYRLRGEARRGEARLDFGRAVKCYGYIVRFYAVVQGRGSMETLRREKREFF